MIDSEEKQDNQAIVPNEESNSDQGLEINLEEHGSSLCDGDVAVDVTQQSTQSEIANSNDLTTYDARQSFSTGSDETESAIQGAVSSGDFGKTAQLKSWLNLTDQQKYFLLKKHYVPSSNYNFPTHVINKIHRHFQYRWLEKNPGLHGIL